MKASARPLLIMLYSAGIALVASAQIALTVVGVLVPDALMSLVTASALVVMCGHVIMLSRPRRRYTMSMENWATALSDRQQVLDKYEESLRRREWTLAWTKTAPKAHTMPQPRHS